MKRLLDYDPPPKARTEIKRMLGARKPGRPPEYGKASALKAAKERWLRWVENQQIWADYKRHHAQLKDERSRQRGLRDEAIDRAAAERCPNPLHEGEVHRERINIEKALKNRWRRYQRK